MIANAGQTFAVFMIVAAAAGYLLVVVRRSWKSGHGSACSGCHTAAGGRSCGSAMESAATSNASATRDGGPESAPVRPQRVFLPVENFADTARRLREEQSQSPERPASVESGAEAQERRA